MNIEEKYEKIKEVLNFKPNFSYTLGKGDKVFIYLISSKSSGKRVESYLKDKLKDIPQDWYEIKYIGPIKLL